jgi:hypothetical protein
MIKRLAVEVICACHTADSQQIAVLSTYGVSTFCWNHVIHFDLQPVFCIIHNITLPAQQSNRLIICWQPVILLTWCG